MQLIVNLFIFHLSVVLEKHCNGILFQTSASSGVPLQPHNHSLHLL